MRFVATGPVPAIANQILGHIAPVEVLPNADEPTLVQQMHDAVGLIVRGDTTISARVIDAAKYLKVIGRTGVGYDNIDVDAATARGIPIVVTPGANSVAVAEATFAAILALCKKVIDMDQKTRSGEWHVRNSGDIGDLQGATLGLVGLGSIGRAVARRALAFEMNILAHDPFVTDSIANELQVEKCGLDELFSRSDIVSLHVGLLPETKGLVNHERLEQMKAGAMLINFGRGALFQSLDVVYEALCSGKLAGAGIDVYPHEPPDVGHPIFSHPKIVFSPHSAALSKRAFERTALMMSESMRAVLEGQRTSNIANPAVFEFVERPLRLKSN